VKFSWTATADTVDYEIYKDNKGNDVYDKLGETKETTFLAKEMEKGLTYDFKIRARNTCGAGEWSDELSVSFHTVPSHM